MPNPLLDKLKTLDGEAVARIYKTVFDSEEGQLMLQDLKNRSFVNAPLPLGQEGDRAEGMRQVILHIETQIDYQPEQPESENYE